MTTRVLLVDDQPLLRTGFRMILSAESDLTVVGEAADGASAVELARRLKPDVVLMDIRMPGMDGIQATRALAGPGVEDPIKVLMLTTFGLDEYVVESLRAGASGFLLKDAPPRRPGRGHQDRCRRRGAAGSIGDSAPAGPRRQPTATRQ